AARWCCARPIGAATSAFRRTWTWASADSAGSSDSSSLGRDTPRTSAESRATGEADASGLAHARIATQASQQRAAQARLAVNAHASAFVHLHLGDPLIAEPQALVGVARAAMDEPLIARAHVATRTRGGALRLSSVE